MVHNSLQGLVPVMPNANLGVALVTVEGASALLLPQHTTTAKLDVDMVDSL
jgi:hypothetical protein